MTTRESASIHGSLLPPDPGNGRSTDGPCPDELTLVGLAEDRLPETVRARVEAHLVDCPACRSGVATVARAASAPDAAARPAGSGWGRWKWAVAAGVVLAVGAALAGRELRGGRGGEGGGGESTDARLASAAQVLVRVSPDLFVGFRPLDRSERLAPVAVGERGGFTLGSPSGRTLETPTEFRWEPLVSGGPYAVTLADATGKPLWTRTVEHPPLTFPRDARPLEPGGYLWEVGADGPFGRTTARRGFTVAGDAEREALSARWRAVDRAVGSDLAGLVKAHVALREGYALEAERLARAYVAQHPADTVARETLGQALGRLGSPEAAEYLRPPERRE